MTLDEAFDEAMKTLCKEFGAIQEDMTQEQHIESTKEKTTVKSSTVQAHMDFADVLKKLKECEKSEDPEKDSLFICAYRDAWPDTKWVELNNVFNAKTGLERKLILAEFIKEKRDVEFSEYSPTHQDMFTSDWKFCISNSSEKKA